MQTVTQFARGKQPEESGPSAREIQTLFERALHFTTLTDSHDVIVICRGQNPTLMETHVCTQVPMPKNSKKAADLYAFPEWINGEIHARRVEDVELRPFPVNAMKGLHELVDAFARRTGRGLYGIGNGRMYGKFEHRVQQRDLSVIVYTNRVESSPHEFVFLVHDAA